MQDLPCICSSGYVDLLEKVTVTLGGRSLATGGEEKQQPVLFLVCGGLTGLNASGKWPAWSPARIEIPKKMEFIATLSGTTEAYLERPKIKGDFFIFLIPGNRMEYTCPNCQLVCHPDKQVKKSRYRICS